jgi:hypothetical protein
MMAPSHQSTLARLFALVFGLLLVWPALGPAMDSAPAAPAGAETQCRDFDPGRGLPLYGDSLLIAEEASETDDNEDGRGSALPADLVARHADFPDAQRPIEGLGRDVLAPAVRWTTPVRERGPPLS